MPSPRLLAVSGLIALAAAAAPASSQAADTMVKIGSQSSGKVLSVESHSPSERAHVIQESFSGDRSQKWFMRQVATFPGTTKIAFEYRNVRSGKCLDLETSPGTNGTLLVQKTCSNALSQQWIRDFAVNTTFLRIQNRRSSMFATGSSSHVVQRPQANASNQFWSVFGTL
jgi:hypothetical protein